MESMGDFILGAVTWTGKWHESAGPNKAGAHWGFFGYLTGPFPHRGHPVIRSFWIMDVGELCILVSVLFCARMGGVFTPVS